MTRLIEALILTGSILAILLIAVVEAVIQVFKPGYSIWQDWIDNE